MSNAMCLNYLCIVFMFYAPRIVNKIHGTMCLSSVRHVYILFMCGVSFYSSEARLMIERGAWEGGMKLLLCGGVWCISHHKIFCTLNLLTARLIV